MKVPILIKFGVWAGDPTCCTSRTCGHDHGGVCVAFYRHYLKPVLRPYYAFDVWKRCRPCREAERRARRLLDNAEK